MERGVKYAPDFDNCLICSEFPSEPKSFERVLRSSVIKIEHSSIHNQSIAAWIGNNSRIEHFAGCDSFIEDFY